MKRSRIQTSIQILNEKRLVAFNNRYKKAPIIKLKREVKNCILYSPSVKLKMRIHRKTNKENFPKLVSTRLFNSIKLIRIRIIKTHRKSNRQKEHLVSAFNNKVSSKSKRKIIKPFKKAKMFRYPANLKSDNRTIRMENFERIDKKNYPDRC